MSAHTSPLPCGCGCNPGKSPEKKSGTAWKVYLPVAASLLLLMAGIALERLAGAFFPSTLRLLWYAVAYAPVGFPVMKEAWETVRKKDFFNEYTLMLTATLGAFLIGEYPEGVAVMLFYAVGELFQESAVSKARNHIRALLDIRPDTATVRRNGTFAEVAPEEVCPGEILQVKAGGKVPLDGVLLSDAGSFNTSALTGESRPHTLRAGETVLAGMFSIDRAVEIKATKTWTDSSLARILEMVQEAGSRKAKTELLIRRFAKVYTPAVFLLALLIATVPYFVVTGYVFGEWLYRALVFLVISCPCALVISVPLGYFGGIGAASRNGILFKGANFLDLMASLNTVVMDKTGTLTKGVFRVQEVVSVLYEPQDFLRMTASLEACSSHPVAKAIAEASPGLADGGEAKQVEEIAGMGIRGYVGEDEVLAGNRRLMQRYGIEYDARIDSLTDTVVTVAVNRRYAGCIRIADEVKEDAAQAIRDMHAQGVRQTVMLSGDRSAITGRVAREIGVGEAFGDLLPEGKVKHLEALKADPRKVVAFVGDGINDAPVLALSDVGIAMGGMGSEAAIEIADVVIQTDQPSRIAVAIRIAKATRRIVKQNITLAVGVKFTVMLLGALGIATMWGAVFADVGVALLAILNAVRILSMKFTS
ncbi:MAG: cadmium-translocating P-type ATPase [Tannerellaceae bacterium]|jgi:Cd2+/Zn2+-exporting ATPase|nr:cadmium-translocating P-type ATPase [Tannerellaceae bacterium]